MHSEPRLIEVQAQLPGMGCRNICDFLGRLAELQQTTTV